MNSQLILRTLTSPFPTPYNDITRGSVLSQEDVDNNFIYIKGQSFYSASSLSGIVTLYRLNGDDFSFSIPPSTGNTDTFVTGGTYTAGTVTFTNTTGGTFTVTGFSTGTTTKYSVTVSLSGDTPYTITHGLGLDVSVDVKDLTNNAKVNVEVDNYQANTVDITSSNNITSARIIIIG